MSRWPLILQPWPSEVGTNEFSVVSEEWSDDASHSLLGKVVYEPDSRSCTFTPEPLRIAEDIFPRVQWSCTAESLGKLRAKPAGELPESIYARRLLQAMERVLTVRAARIDSGPPQS